jgi:hypothetical protein
MRALLAACLIVALLSSSVRAEPSSAPAAASSQRARLQRTGNALVLVGTVLILGGAGAALYAIVGTDGSDCANDFLPDICRLKFGVVGGVGAALIVGGLATVIAGTWELGRAHELAIAPTVAAHGGGLAASFRF